MHRHEKLDFQILTQGSFITDNELNSALSSSFVSCTGVRVLTVEMVLTLECNLLPVSGKGREDYETWMNFAKIVAILTMSTNLPLLFRKKMLHPVRLGIFTLILNSKFDIFYMKYHGER